MPSTDLRDYIRVLSRRRWTVVLTMVIAVGLALAYSFVKTPMYSASASVLIPEQQAASTLNATSPQLPQAQSQQRFLADEQTFAEGDAVKQLARKATGQSGSISVGSSANADLLTFNSSSTNRVNAAAIANAYANAYITARRVNQVAQYTQEVTALQASITNLQTRVNAAPPGSSEALALTQAMQTLNESIQQAQAAAQLSSSYGPSVVKAAIVPSSPSSPKPTRNGLLGLAIGIVLGIGFAFLRERLDEGLTSREVAEKASGGLPIVALIPLVEAWKNKAMTHVSFREDPKSTVAEAYRTLRTSVQFLGLDEPKRVIGITSSAAGEGKTTATANLAVSFAKAGTRVAVMSGDLRRPRIHDFFGLTNDTGLTTVLVGSSTIPSALKEIPDENNLALLPSGPIPPNPAEILSLDRVREIVDYLVERYDLVLIDCPPVLPVSDTLLLSRLVDGMLVLASARLTTRTQLARTYELLRQVHTPLLGTVLNLVPAGDAYSYGYEYGYYAESYAEPGTQPHLSTDAVENRAVTVERPQESPQSGTERVDRPEDPSAASGTEPNRHRSGVSRRLSESLGHFPTPTDNGDWTPPPPPPLADRTRASEREPDFAAETELPWDR